MVSIIPELHIDPTKLTNWQRAVKTKAIFAAKTQWVVPDIHVMSKLVLETLEGQQKMDLTKVLCMGLTSADIWQMAESALFEKYSVTGLTDDGWMYCEPKKDNSVSFWQIEDFTGKGMRYARVKALTGAEVHPDIKNPNYVEYLQFGEVGDYLLKDTTNPENVWIVKKTFFEQTYSTELSETDPDA